MPFSCCLQSGEMKIVASHLAGFGVTIEEMHRRVDDLSNIKECVICVLIRLS